MTSRRPEPGAAESAAAARASGRHIRSSGLMLVGRVLGAALNFATQVLIVRHLAKADYGAFAYAFAFMMLGSHLMGLGLERSVNRFVPIYQERREFEKMAGALILAVGAICGCGVALVALVYGLRGVIGELVAPDPLALSLLLILVCMAPVQALDNLTVKLFAIFASPRAVFLRRYVLTPGLKLAAVLALLAFRGDAVFLALAYFSAGLLGVAISVWVIVGVLRDQDLLRHFRAGAFRLPARRLFRFGLPLLVIDAVHELRGNLVVILLGALASSTGVATFRAVLPVARLNDVVFDSFTLLFMPMASRMYARGERTGINELYWKCGCWMVVFTFPIFAASFAFAEPLTVLLFGERYAESGAVLALLAFGMFVNVALGFNSRILQVFHRVRAIVRIDLFVAGVAVALNVVLIRSFGALGGAAASCAVLILQNVLCQAALIRCGAVEAMDLRFLKVMLTIAAATATLFASQAIFAPPLVLAALATGLVSLVVVWITGPLLDVETVFPELRRYAAARWLLGMEKQAPAVGGGSELGEVRSDG